MLKKKRGQPAVPNNTGSTPRVTSARGRAKALSTPILGFPNRRLKQAQMPIRKSSPAKPKSPATDPE